MRLAEFKLDNKGWKGYSKIIRVLDEKENKEEKQSMTSEDGKESGKLNQPW